jgi:hypothetical protein
MIGLDVCHGFFSFIPFSAVMHKKVYRDKAGIFRKNVERLA